MVSGSSGTKVTRSLRQTTIVDSIQLGRHRATAIPILDRYELVAGKLAALVTRTQARDLFDCRRIFTTLKLNSVLLRVGFAAYGGMNRKDWRTVAIDDIGFDAKDLAARLIPTLHGSATPKRMSPEDYGRVLVGVCHKVYNLLCQPACDISPASYIHRKEHSSNKKGERPQKPRPLVGSTKRRY